MYVDIRNILIALKIILYIITIFVIYLKDEYGESWHYWISLMFILLSNMIDSAI